MPLAYGQKSLFRAAMCSSNLMTRAEGIIYWMSRLIASGYRLELKAFHRLLDFESYPTPLSNEDHQRAVLSRSPEKKPDLLALGNPNSNYWPASGAKIAGLQYPETKRLALPMTPPTVPEPLVMVELTNNRQIQRHYEAGRSLVNILQTFSNLSKKSKTQEEEIEQWKQSLTFQEPGTEPPRTGTGSSSGTGRAS